MCPLNLKMFKILLLTKKNDFKVDELSQTNDVHICKVSIKNKINIFLNKNRKIQKQDLRLIKEKTNN